MIVWYVLFGFLSLSIIGGIPVLIWKMRLDKRREREDEEAAASAAAQ